MQNNITNKNTFSLNNTISCNTFFTLNSLQTVNITIMCEYLVIQTKKQGYFLN